MGIEIGTALLYAGLGSSILGGVTSTIGQLQQAEAQSKSSEQQALVANQNAALAEEEARQARRDGYENKLKKRQEVAGIISAQRAQQGASGALVDAGSFMDTTLDTLDKGEADAMELERVGFEQGYAKDLEAYNYHNQANNLQWQAKQAKDSKKGILLSGAMSILGDAAMFGTNWYDKVGKDSLLKGAADKSFNGVTSPTLGQLKTFGPSYSSSIAPIKFSF